MDSFTLNVAGISYNGKGIDVIQSSTSVVGTMDAPLRVFVDSDTDWAAVIPSAAGVIVALIVAWLSIKVQRTQVRASISALRGQWMVELRTCASEYLQALVSLIIRLKTQGDYSKTPEYLAAYDRIIVLTSRFEMLLSRDDQDTKEILTLDQKIMDKISSFDDATDVAELVKDLNQLKKLLRKELENAWGDVKFDVGVGERKVK